MKKFIIISCLCLFSEIASAKIQVFACEPEWKALVEEIGGDKVEVYSATTAFQDPHHIEARPSLIAKIRKTDLLVCTGSDMEVGWLPLLLRQSSSAQLQPGAKGYFMASEQVERLEVPEEIDRSAGDVHAGGNPHVHLDPYRLLQIARALKEKLISLDSSNKQAYESNLSRFEIEWTKKTAYWEEKARTLEGKKAVVIHKNWSYLVHWLGIEVVADLEPKPGIPPSSSHLAKLVGLIENQQPDFLLVAAYQDEKGAKWLAEKTGIEIIRLPYTVGGHGSATDLFSLYEESIDLLLDLK